MKKLILATMIFATGCSATSKKESALAPEVETYFAVTPTPKTRVTTYHVQTAKFHPALQIELDETLSKLKGKCWYWAVPSHKATVDADGADYCLKFVKFTKVDLLKPYKPLPTDVKMLLTASSKDASVKMQIFDWDGKKLRRILNSDSQLEPEGMDRFSNFLISWAIK